MQTIEAGKISQMLDRIFNSFLKSMENLFSDKDGKGDTKVQSERNKVVVHSEVVPSEPKLDENGNKLAENAAVFELVIIAQWPKDEVLTRKDAEKIATDGWGTDIWEKAESIQLEMQFKGKDRYSQKGLKKNQLDREISRYTEDKDILNLATKRVRDLILLFKEVDKYDESENSEESDQNANASRKLNMTLKKIVGKKETSIKLMKINANYDLNEAMDDIDALVSDNDFIDQLPDNEEINYEVTSDETNYDVNECGDFSCDDTIKQAIFDTLYTANKLRILSMAGLRDGSGTNALQTGTLAYTFDCILAVLGDSLYDSKCGIIPGFEFAVDEQEITTDGSIQATAIGILEGYLSSIDIASDCLSRGCQYKLGQHISYVEDFLRGIKQEN